MKSRMLALSARFVSLFGFLILSGLLLGLRANAQTQPPVSFLARQDVPAGNDPRGFAFGHFFPGENQTMDLVVANQGDPGGISILQGITGGGGAAGGTFRHVRDIAVGLNPVAVAVGDFNRDGNDDIAVLDPRCDPNDGGCGPWPGVLWILLGNGDGTFQTPVSYPAGDFAGFSYDIFSADFNGDGKLDLVVNSSGGIGSNQAIAVLLGNGDGTFQPFQFVTSAAGVGGRLLRPIDLNGDGKLDFALAGGSTVWVLLGNGDGTFQSPLSTPVQAGALTIDASDFNRDGKIDLAVTGAGCGSAGCNVVVSVLFGNGDGTFQSPVTYGLNGGFDTGTSLTAVDVNMDGNPDLVVTSPASDAVAILLNNGDGTFRAGQRYGVGQSPRAVGSYCFDCGQPIFNLLVVNLQSNDVSILIAKGDGTFDSSRDTPGVQTPQAIAAGDFNRDGKLDVAVTDFNCTPQGCGPATVDILLGNGDGTFQPPSSFSIGPSAGAIVVSDFNGDGVPDLAVAVGAPPQTSTSVAVYLGNGDGTFRAPVFNAVVNYPSSMVTGDFNGDGKPDLAVMDGSSISVLLGNGDGTFQSPVSYAIQFGSSLVAGDVNGDGKLDLVSSNGCSTSVLFGNGDGTFQPAQNSSATSCPGGFVAAGDFNGDGKLDLVSAYGSDMCMGNCTTGAAQIMLGNGDGTFQAPVSYQVGILPKFVLVGDFNGDGKLDVAVTNFMSNDVSVLVGNGDGTFQTPVNFGVAPGPLALAAGDFDGDGRVDLVSANSLHSISLLSNKGLLPLSAATVTPTSLSFGNQNMGTTSAPQSITLTNKSSSPLSIHGIFGGGDFPETNNCLGLLSPGASCAISVTFTPSTQSSSGPARSTSLIINDDAGSGTQFVSLSGVAISPPFICCTNAATGPVGTSVGISGSGFTGTTSVTFNGTSASFQVKGDSFIAATVPNGATSGPITVTNSAGSASWSSFTVTSQAIITSFSPASGPVGATVTINGSNFSSFTAIAFNGTNAIHYKFISDAQLQADVPLGATSGPITVVTNNNGTATSATNFTVLPRIASFSPTSGSMGTAVTITGTSFTGATSVTFNFTPASFTVVSDTQINATVPGGAMTGRVRVTTPSGTVSNFTNFTAISTAAPTISSFTPASGAVGWTVTLTGTNFTGTTGVTFNGTAVTSFIRGISDTQIRLDVPNGATSGPITVTNTLGTATSATNFTVLPRIASFTPTSGPAGTVVTLMGTNLGDVTAVTFNRIAAAFTVVSSTQINATVPAGATTGFIRVTSPEGTAASFSSFTVN